MNNEITLPKIEYDILSKQAQAYRKIMGRIFEFVIRDSAENVVNDFRKTDLYSEEFLKDLKIGLKKSSYFKHHGN